MVSFSSLLVTLLASTALTRAGPLNERNDVDCLTDGEADRITKRWLNIFDTDFLKNKGKAYLEDLVTKDISQVDNSYGAANIGIDALFASASFVDIYVTNVIQVPVLVFHSCDKIAARWNYAAVSTGVPTGNGPTVPKGTPIKFQGTEIIEVDLKSRLIHRTQSSADWVLLARGLGQTVVL